MNLSVAQVEECVFLVVWGIINSDSHDQDGPGFGNRYGQSCFKQKKKKSAAKTKCTGNLPYLKASRPNENGRSSKTVATSSRAVAHIGHITLFLYTNSLLEYSGIMKKEGFSTLLYLKTKPRSACPKPLNS